MAKATTEQQKKGFSQIKKKRQVPENTVSPPIQQQVVVKPKSEKTEKKAKRMGRGSHKPPGANDNYVRIGALVPKEFRDRMKLSLLTYLKGDHKSMDEMIYVAIEQYLNSKDPESKKGR